MEKLKKNKLKRTNGIAFDVSFNSRRGEIVKKEHNQEKAITLIALVISVIVLLILARHLDLNVKSARTAYFHVQERQK